MWREKEEQKKAQEKHWDLTGSKLGNLIGVKATPDETSNDDAGMSYRYIRVLQFLLNEIFFIGFSISSITTRCCDLSELNFKADMALSSCCFRGH